MAVIFTSEIVWIIVIVTSIGVFVDATNLGVRKGLIDGFFDMSPIMWALCCLLLWIVAFPAYLITRPRYVQALRHGEESRREPTRIEHRAESPPNLDFRRHQPLFCENCGNQLNDTAKFCPGCGNKIL